MKFSSLEGFMFQILDAHNNRSSRFKSLRILIREQSHSTYVRICFEVSSATTQNLQSISSENSISQRWHLNLKWPVKYPVTNLKFFPLSLRSGSETSRKGITNLLNYIFSIDIRQWAETWESYDLLRSSEWTTERLRAVHAASCYGFPVFPVHSCIYLLA